MIACVALIYVRFSSGAECWSKNACIETSLCAAKGGISQPNLCSGGNTIRCCSCANCMEASLCVSRGGVPSTGICPGSSNHQCCNMASTSVPTGGKTPVNRMLTDLADILRGAGLTVIESEGWKTRGHGIMTSVKGILVHHTAGPATGDFPSLKVVRDGRTDLAGPLSQLGLGRSGTWYVIAAGRSYHAGATIDDSIFGNANAIGIEAEATGSPSTNTGHASWPEVQYQSYIRGVKALQAAYAVPTSRVLGHKEAAVPLGRKPDPNFSMDEFRAALAK
ncbi:unnamed protein product [Adineta steineri]|uniref:N-acetylmuramoyl-L-alanine amidase domain-containing protein n=1 Tax=Adineta steineri TaxID=433720 RepID=A0A814P8Q6_9BILA|nr:unnamed protein product [Adineta steineri]CAF1101387.1 unnamed protein product [Adineta steineri]